MTRQLVVIDNGVAATRLVQRLVERDPVQFATAIVDDEPHLTYNRIRLSPPLAGERTAAQLPLLPAEWYTRHGVCLRSGGTVDEVDVEQRRLRIAETWLPQDELVFTTGSRSFIPPPPGRDRPQVIPFRTLADVERILAIPGPAMVIGSRVLGVEAATALCHHGGKVTLIRCGSGLMAPLTDAFAADELGQQLEARGIRCVLGCRIAAVEEDGIRLADGCTFHTDRVVLAAGVQPNGRLAVQSGVLCRQGIVVDRQMAASSPGISAVGERCEIDDQTWRLVAPCLRQAEVLTDHLCGAPGKGFVWQDVGARLKITGVELFSIEGQQAGEQDDIYANWDPIDRHYRRLLLCDGRLRGVLLMGSCTAAAALTACLESDEPATADWLSDPSSTQPWVAGIVTMTKPVLMLVEHGMIGHHFLEQCVSRNLYQQYRVVVFGEECYTAYDRVHLSEYLAGRSAQSLSLVADDFFHQHGIELRLGEAVAVIDRDTRLVRDTEGHEAHWDELVLATGSYPFVPPVSDSNLDGCFVYCTLDDLDRITAHAAAARTGVVIDGGLPGLGAANVLKRLELGTHVVEFTSNLMAVQLDDGGAAMLREKIVVLDVEVYTSKATTAIMGEADGLRLNFTDGSALRTDMVVFSAGIHPQGALTRGCMLRVGERGSIHIDDQCRTSDSDVLVIGECALWGNKIYGLVAPGYQMTRIAMATLAGGDACFNGADMSTKLRLLGVDVTLFGGAQRRTPGCQSYQWTGGP